ncbi:MAG: transporter substrate-binding domain-containing protein, partial [Cyanobacteria bacterium P01_H01_bin.121]
MKWLRLSLTVTAGVLLWTNVPAYGQTLAHGEPQQRQILAQATPETAPETTPSDSDTAPAQTQVPAAAGELSSLETAQAPDPLTLKVGINEIQPFVFLSKDRAPYGFSIDLWGQIAQELAVETEFVRFDDVASLLDAVRAGEVNLGIAGISITLDREAQGIDFSYPIYESGLQLVILEQQVPAWQSVLNHLGGTTVFF